MSETRLRRLATDPLESNYIPSLQQTTPEVLWVGCSDSNFKECTMLNILDDELLVLRNIGNMIIDGDLSCDTTIKHAVVDLQVVLDSKAIASSSVLLRPGETHRRLRPLWVSHCESNCERRFERPMVKVSLLPT
jgi:hypothetical protein